MFGPCAIFLLPTEFFRAPTELLSRGRAGGLVDLLSLLGASVYLDLSLKNDASLRPADEDGVAGLPPAVAKIESPEFLGAVGKFFDYGCKADVKCPRSCDGSA